METNNLPAAVYHADWGSDHRKRRFAKALLTPGGYGAYPPVPVGDHRTFIDRIKSESGSVLVGFDFPIGLPARYAALIGATAFPAFLRRLGEGAFAKFYRIAERANEISIDRPFYPYRPGGTSHSHLISSLRMTCIDDLRRQCELGYDGRRAACPLFWTLGANQVGRAAILGWRDVLVPALRDRMMSFGRLTVRLNP
jgi:hypothetical protein